MREQIHQICVENRPTSQRPVDRHLRVTGGPSARVESSQGSCPSAGFGVTSELALYFGIMPRFCLFLLFTLSISVCSFGQPSVSKSDRTQTAEQNQVRQGAAAQVFAQAGVKQGRPADPNSSDSPKHDVVDTLNAASTVVIAVFTFGMFVCIWMQIAATKRTERAWIIVSPLELAPPIGFVPSANAGNIENHLVGVNQQNVFSCAIKNTGNTPAQLLKFAMSYRSVNSVSEIPATPKYGEKDDVNGLLLVKEDSVGFETVLEPNPILTKTEWDAVHAQKMTLYVFGIVAYKDVYGKSHETRFGYLYFVPQGGDRTQRGFNREKMPRAYNSAT